MFMFRPRTTERYRRERGVSPSQPRRAPVGWRGRRDRAAPGAALRRGVGQVGIDVAGVRDPLGVRRWHVHRLGVGVLGRHHRAGRGAPPDRRDHPRRCAADASPPGRRQTAPGTPRRRRTRTRAHARLVAGDGGRDLPAVRVRRRRRERVRGHRRPSGAPIARPRGRGHDPASSTAARSSTSSPTSTTASPTADRA